MVLDQDALGLADRLFHRMELLRQVGAGPPFLHHADDLLKMPVGPLQPIDDVRMAFVTHDAGPISEAESYPPDKEAIILSSVRGWGNANRRTHWAASSVGGGRGRRVAGYIRK